MRYRIAPLQVQTSAADCVTDACAMFMAIATPMPVYFWQLQTQSDLQ